MTENASWEPKPIPIWRTNAKKKRELQKTLPKTEEHEEARIAYNTIRRTQYKELTVAERIRPLGTPADIDNRRIRRQYLSAQKCISSLTGQLNEVQSDATRSYIKNSKLKSMINTSVESIIFYLTGPLCNMDPYKINSMDEVERLGLFIQLKRVNETYFALEIEKNRRWNGYRHKAYLINNYQKTCTFIRRCRGGN